MAKSQYWLNLFTVKTWEEFNDHGASVTGFTDRRWSQVQKIQPGDYLICYITGISRFAGILEVTGKPFKSSERIWEDQTFPSRVPVRVVVSLDPETAIPVQLLRDHLSMFKNLKNPMMWSGAFRGSPAKWKAADGETILNAINEASRRPVLRPLDPKKFKYKPKTVASTMGPVTIPESENEITTPSEPVEERRTEHLEMQHLLLKLGSDLGLDVWVARNDRNREFDGTKLASMPNIKDLLPLQFDDATNRTIELIDVLWLKGNSIQAAFEIESTTSIYSGLLRMADLVSMQPNLDIPIFIVAPDDRREKVMQEVLRPTFRQLDTPLHEICRYIPFTALREKVIQVKDVLPYLKMEFIEELAESFSLDDD